MQPDGTYLYLLDLDQHAAGQHAHAQLQRVLQRVGPVLAAKLAIRVSRSGTGYHLPFKTARQIDTARTAAARVVAQTSHAKRIMTALTSPAGLTHPALRQLAVRDLPQRVAIARRRLAAVGETVPPITITL